jgi:hypothetical protein
MLLEIIWMYGAFIVLLFFLAEAAKMRAYGIIASLCLMMLGFYFVADNIQVRTGELVSSNFNLSSSQTGLGFLNGTSQLNNLTNQTNYNENTSMNVSGSGNETKVDTITYVFSNVPASSVTPLGQTWGLMLILIGLYGAYHYVLVFFFDKSYPR